MSEIKKRPYKSTARSVQAAQTRGRILASAKNLFESEGFECVTIEVVEQGWTSDEYEKWLAQLLINTLVGFGAGSA